MARKADPSEKLIASMLNLVAERDWSAVSLSDIADDAGIALSQCYDLFPAKTVLAAAYFSKTDLNMLRQVEQERAQDRTSPDSTTEPHIESVRERLFDVAMARFDVMANDKPFLAALETACRHDLSLGLSLFPAWRRSVRCVLEAAGIDTSGLRGLSRRKIYGAALLMAGRTWLGDDSADMARTMATLDKQLLRIEQLREALPSRC